MSTTYSEEDLATLTDEERAVILDDDGAAEANRKALAAIANGGDDDDEEDADGGDDGDSDADAIVENDDKAKEDDAAKLAASDDVAQKTVVVDEAPERFRPTYHAELPASFTQTAEQVETNIADLKAKFKAGEIDFDEYESQKSEHDKYLRELDKALVKVDISKEMSAQSANQEWVFTVKSFVNSIAKEGGTDYRTDEAKRGDLDQFIKVLAANDANKDKDQEWFLREAHKRVNILHGIATVAPKKEDPVTEAKNKRKVNLEAAPKTLSQVPGSDGPGDVGDEFSTVDSLSGDAFESAIAKMSPAQREKFMSRA
ncbi:hypothetical protein ACO0K3_03680 [Undibacterium sp. Rencai35W]|uniref:hypothetical protein n=1 Tax=Undibacterium sp. Rencai35W TaxID=3413046 RepID=UPI003BEFDE10